MSTVCIYHGPSRLNRNHNIVVILQTGVTKNRKIGNTMVQVWILYADADPASVLSAHDERIGVICGDCPLIGAGCYVTVGFAPQAIWRAWKRGNVPMVNSAQMAQMVRGRNVRFGAYGDPAAMPVTILRTISRYARKTVGYSHQWRKFPDVAPYVMASVETESQQTEAMLLGFRTFRTMLPGEAKNDLEIICPASPEGGDRRSCDNCMACSGAGTGRSIAIYAHGSKATMSNYIRTRETQNV